MGKLKKWKSRVLAIATLFCMMAMMMPGSAVAAGTFTDHPVIGPRIPLSRGWGRGLYQATRMTLLNRIRI